MITNNDFVPNGKKIMYWDNGKIKMEGEWQDGKRVGLFKLYDRGGNLVTTINYSNDLIHDEVNRYYEGDVTLKYIYNTGTLLRSDEYLNTLLVGTYGYGDAYIYTETDAVQPPPIGTLYHSYNGEHPAELFKGTLWTYVENEYFINDQGNEQAVDIWLREPNGGKGPYVYIGDFKEYYNSGKLLRSGSYKRIVKDGEASISVLNGPESLYREDGSVVYQSKWENGLKTDFVKFGDKQSRMWKTVRLGNKELYETGTYNVFDIGMDGDINYVFDPVTQSATLKLLK